MQAKDIKRLVIKQLKAKFPSLAAIDQERKESLGQTNNYRSNGRL